MVTYDSVIIGGGPIGCRTASIVSSAGFSTCVLEEHNIIGSPVQCAGIVTPRVLEIAPFKNSVQNWINGARIYSPSGRVMAIESNEPKAVVIDRAIFDKEMAKEAVYNGAELLLGSKALNLSMNSGKVEIRYVSGSDEKKITTTLVIGADGIQGRVAKSFGFDRPKAFLYGVGAETTKTSLNGKIVELYSGNAIAPGFFAWAIPTSKGDARLGLCVRKKSRHIMNAHNYFNNFLDLKEIKMHGVSSKNLTQFSAGAIPIGILNATVKNNVMLVGDAAAQVKPTSGGGIYTGLRCAEHCGNIAVDALKKNNCSEKQLMKYEYLWRKEIGKELKRGWVIHSIYSSLTDKQLEDVFDILNKPSVLRLIEKEGDLDFASNLSSPLLKKAPALIKFTGKFLKTFL